MTTCGEIGIARYTCTGRGNGSPAVVRTTDLITRPRVRQVGATVPDVEGLGWPHLTPLTA